jgi:hypothetical protein
MRHRPVFAEVRSAWRPYFMHGIRIEAPVFLVLKLSMPDAIEV